jgi:Zn-finger nucleic acid-binding protein
MTIDTLSCPRCGAPLTPLRVGGTSTDICEHRGGLWLDAGELAQIRR